MLASVHAALETARQIVIAELVEDCDDVLLPDVGDFHVARGALGSALLRLNFDPRSDVERLDGRNRRHLVVTHQARKLSYSAAIGPARARIADVGGEEFQEANR